jgi:hypothetical protein
MTGLFLGLVCMIGGIALFLNGVSGSTNWTAKILGNESTITDAAPGAILFTVGLFVIIVTRYKAKFANMEERDGNKYIIKSDVCHLEYRAPKRNTDEKNIEETSSKKNFFFHLLTKIKDAIERIKKSIFLTRTDEHWHDKIDAIVEKAISENKENNHSSFSFKTEAEALRFREYFASYFNSILDILMKANELNGNRLSETIDRLFKKTALNGWLDASYASYLIRDYILDLRNRLRFFGASIHRIEFCWEWLSKSWREIDMGIAKYDFIDYTIIQRVASAKIRKRIKA